MQTPTSPSFDDLSKDELIELLKAERAMSKFLRDLFMTISFEFQTPATIIVAYANLILREEGGFFPKLTEEQTKSIETMMSAGERIHEAFRFNRQSHRGLLW